MPSVVESAQVGVIASRILRLIGSQNPDDGQNLEINVRGEQRVNVHCARQSGGQSEHDGVVRTLPDQEVEEYNIYRPLKSTV